MDGKKATACGSNYQDNVTTPLAHKHDDNAIADNEIDEDGVVMDGTETAVIVLSSTGKVGHPWFYCLFFRRTLKILMIALEVLKASRCLERIAP